MYLDETVWLWLVEAEADEEIASREVQMHDGRLLGQPGAHLELIVASGHWVTCTTTSSSTREAASRLELAQIVGLLDLPHQLGHVPHLDGVVHAARGEHRVVAAELERVDGPRVRHKARHQHRRRHVPHEHARVCAARRQQATARRELEHVDGQLVAGELAHAGARQQQLHLLGASNCRARTCACAGDGADVEDAHAAVGRAGRQVVAVRMEADALDVAQVVHVDAHRLVLVGRPDARRPVHAARGKVVAVRSELDVPHGSVVTLFQNIELERKTK